MTLVRTTSMIATARMVMIIESPIAAAPADVAIVATLFVWFSPAFPTGGYTYSHGLETAVAEGLVTDESGLRGWIAAILTHGAGWSDAVLLRLAYAATGDGDLDACRRVADLAVALAPSRERLAESLAQGEAFIAAVRAGWPDVAPTPISARLGYAVAAGIATRGLGADLRTTICAYLTGFCSNLAAAGVRLGLCGQGGAVRILASMGATIADIAARAETATEVDLGGCALGADIASLRHETLNGRLFAS